MNTLRIHRPETKETTPRKELHQLIEELDDFHTRLVLGFIKALLDPKKSAPAERRRAA